LLAALLLYGFHSLTAAISWKAQVARLVGDRALHGLYRLSYTVVSIVTLLPILRFMGEHPGRRGWSASATTADMEVGPSCIIPAVYVLRIVQGPL
jgi:hypothetical protein